MTRRDSRITIVMEDDLRDKVLKLANLNRRSVSDFVRLVLWDYVNAEDFEADEDDIEVDES